MHASVPAPVRDPSLLSISTFAGGVVLLQQLPELPARPAILAVALVAVLTALLIFTVGRRTVTFGVLAWLALAGAAAGLGFSWAAWRAAERLDDALPAALEGQDIRLTGVVASLPQRFARGERFELMIESAELASSVTNASNSSNLSNASDSPSAPTASGRADNPADLAAPAAPLQLPSRVLLTWYHAWDDEGDELGDASDAATANDVSQRATPPLHPGERWRFTVRLKRPHGGANPGGFDYEASLFERGIRATGYVRSRSPPQRLAAFVPSFAVLVERARDVLRERFIRTLGDAPYAGVLEALAIGEQQAIPESQWRLFNRTGVTHLMSISGLHVTMLAALCGAQVGFLWRRSVRLMLWQPAQRAAIVAGWLTACAYALLAGFAVPAQRTLYMLSVVALSLCSGRHFGAARTLLLALLAVLLCDPWAVLSVGFWLSFGAVGVLLYVGTPRVGAVPAWRDWRGHLAQWGTTQWAVTVGSLPLLLLLFQQFSLVSPLANAVAIPLVSFVITPLALLFAALPWPPLIGLDHAVLSLLMACLESLAEWPLWQQPAPSLGATLLALLGVLCLLLPRGFPARWVGAFLMLPALTVPAPRPAAGEFWLDVLDVGHGLAVLVRTQTHSLLYDTGPRYHADADAGRRVVVPFLRASGVTRLDTLLVSHRDNDHSGGTASVMAALPVVRTLSSMQELGGDRCRAGETWAWDGVRFRVLHPLPDAYERAQASNHLSCVLRVESAGGRSALLVADIEASDEAALLARAPAALRSDVLVAPHHGSRSSSTPAFVSAVAARDVVFSAAYRDRFGHPAPEVLARYAEARHWRSDRDGAIHFCVSDVLTASAYRQTHRHYWNTP
ncbi:DNA internalization-related competence protein ComEC/Rec2 [Rhodocyclus gracilis]|uniref:DNA internalization-related competence protein ComEC/Rec2 n=1 Tax=Rhodocyclus tenuis TaxID=1066 RepID=A0A6L5JU71_RHOTE|nr:DNA internalization-related competence protein ComEC/Rec2 [Rhodocyclus gracilis]MQY50907.1 DNA internalization-related competence protein ComEC/Rec2 [Rhodocyclus gracilis]